MHFKIIYEQAKELMIFNFTIFPSNQKKKKRK